MWSINEIDCTISNENSNKNLSEGSYLYFMFDLKQDVYSVKEAFLILKSWGLTKSEQIVRRWIRGEVPGKKLISIAPPNNATKLGHKIKKEDLEDFLQKHVKKDLVSRSNEKVTRSKHEEVQNLKDTIKRLEAENSLLKIGNNKSNDKTPEESKNELSIMGNCKKIRLSAEEIDKILNDKYKEVKDNKLFVNLTEKAYDRLLYSLASQFAEGVATEYEIKRLKEEVEELNLLAGKKIVTIEDRMVLKGLGVSIGEIIKKLPDKKDDVSSLVVLGANRDSIKIRFYYNKSYYTAEVKLYSWGARGERLDKWTLKNMVKTATNKPAKDTTIKKIVHSTIKQTFEKLYELEQKSNQSFYLSSDTILRR